MTILEQVIWAEKYRPHTIAECILPERLKTMFQNIVSGGELPHLMLYGGPGVGKTSLAKAICDELGMTYLFTNGSKDRSVSYVSQQIGPFVGTVAFNGKRKAVIIDEADGATADYQDALKSLIETYSLNASFIFLANRPTKLIDPIHSRTGGGIEIRVLPEERDQMMLAVFRRMREVLTEEGVKFDKEAVAGVVKKFFPDYRRIITALQNLSKSGEITIKSVGHVIDPANYAELYKALKGKNIKVAREWVVNTVDMSNVDLFIRDLYDNVKVYLKPETIPAAIMLFGKYQAQVPMVADQEINIMCMLIEMMSECEYL